MFRAMIIYAIVIALTVSKQDHTDHMEVVEISHATATIAVIEVEANHQQVFVAAIVTARDANRFRV